MILSCTFFMHNQCRVFRVFIFSVFITPLFWLFIFLYLKFYFIIAIFRQDFLMQPKWPWVHCHDPSASASTALALQGWTIWRVLCILIYWAMMLSHDQLHSFQMSAALLCLHSWQFPSHKSLFSEIKNWRYCWVSRTAREGFWGLFLKAGFVSPFVPLHCCSFLPFCPIGSWLLPTVWDFLGSGCASPGLGSEALTLSTCKRAKQEASVGTEPSTSECKVLFSNASVKR